MNVIKSIIPLLLILFVVFLAIGPTFAQYATVTAEIEPKTDLHVGDIVTVTVTVENDYLVDFYPVSVYAPIPDGLQYLSHVVPDKTLQNYDPATEIWGVFRMRHDERGHNKMLIITYKVLPGAEGKTITAYARFNQLVLEASGIDLTSRVRPSSEVTDPVALIAPIADFTATPVTGDAPLTVHFTDTSRYGPTSWWWDFGDGATSRLENPTHNYTTPGSYTVSLTTINREGGTTKTKHDYIIVKNDDPGPPGPPGPSIGNNSGPSIGNGSNLIDNIGNLTFLDNDLSAKLKKGGGGGGKAYELSNNTAQDPLGIYILAALLIIGLITLGYFYGIKNKR